MAQKAWEGLIRLNIFRRPRISFPPDIDFGASNPRADTTIANLAPVALATEVVDIAVADPHHAIPLFRDTRAQIDFVSVVRKPLVESANPFPQAASDEESETGYPGQIYNQWFLYLSQ
jgi:hypothetical protein